MPPLLDEAPSKTTPFRTLSQIYPISTTLNRTSTQKKRVSHGTSRQLAHNRRQLCLSHLFFNYDSSCAAVSIKNAERKTLEYNASRIDDFESLVMIRDNLKTITANHLYSLFLETITICTEQKKCTVKSPDKFVLFLVEN